MLLINHSQKKIDKVKKGCLLFRGNEQQAVNEVMMCELFALDNSIRSLALDTAL